MRRNKADIWRLFQKMREYSRMTEKQKTDPLQAQTGLFADERKSTAENRAFSVEIISSFSGGEPAG